MLNKNANQSRLLRTIDRYIVSGSRRGDNPLKHQGGVESAFASPRRVMSGPTLEVTLLGSQARFYLRSERVSWILKSMLNQGTSLDLLFQALAVPARRVMVERLSHGPASVSELAEPLAISLPAVIQHLQVLEASGLVRSEKAGRIRTCSIEPAAMQVAEDWIAGRRANWEGRLDRLARHLGEADD